MLELFVSLHTFVAGRKADIEERGATAIEYSLMVGLIAIAIITAVTLFGNKVKATFNSVANTLPGQA
jgi:pilus assembly protein Flp/PilA